MRYPAELHGPSPRLLLPDAPALIAGHGRATLLTPDGELLDLPSAELRRALDGAPPLLVHGPATARRLDLPRFDACFDLLELFAFCLPARPAAADAARPGHGARARPAGRCRRRRRAAAGDGDHPATATRRRPWQPMNRDAGHPRRAPDGEGRRLALGAFGPRRARRRRAKAPLDPYKVWRRLPEWEDPGPAQPPASFDVSPAEARTRLSQILGEGAEQRPQQADYASDAACAFAPRAGRASRM